VESLRASIDFKFPGTMEKFAQGNYAEALKPFGKADIGYLYWYAAGSASAFALDPLTTANGMRIPVAMAMFEKALALDPEYSAGSLYDFAISFYAGLPESMGGSKELAKRYFEKSLALSGGKTSSAYLAYATGICIPEQDLAKFKELLGRVLDIDIEAYPAGRLVNVLNQRKAGWYLTHIDDYFAVDDIEETKK
jgi:predicted anti-sigma-YlaC factor YlaD